MTITWSSTIISGGGRRQMDSEHVLKLELRFVGLLFIRQINNDSKNFYLDYKKRMLLPMTTQRIQLREHSVKCLIGGEGYMGRDTEENHYEIIEWKNRLKL